MKRHGTRLSINMLEDRCTPATFYLAAPHQFQILTDTGPAGLTAGDTVRLDLGGNQAVTLIYGKDGFGRPEDAVSAANANGDANNTIRVAPTTVLSFAPQMYVAKDLSIVGAGQNITTIQNTVQNGVNQSGMGPTCLSNFSLKTSGDIGDVMSGWSPASIFSVASSTAST